MVMGLEPSTLTALLEHWPVARLATLTPDGAPHVLPVVFVPRDGWVYSPLDGKRKVSARLARVRNVEADARASLLLDGYAEDWSQLWWVRLDGLARVERDDGALLDDVATRLRGKYPQYAQLEPYAAEPTLLALRWARVSVWTQSGDSGPILEALTAL